MTPSQMKQSSQEQTTTCGQTDKENYLPQGKQRMTMGIDQQTQCKNIIKQVVETTVQQFPQNLQETIDQYRSNQAQRQPLQLIKRSSIGSLVPRLRTSSDESVQRGTGSNNMNNAFSTDFPTYETYDYNKYKKRKLEIQLEMEISKL